ncbi:hypothetical protein EV673_0009 [Limnobacter thiooxidans]|uniref:Uncharacterized protein n=1 Tax=Limnobacter thiooxidans TaxID=131080 RepID=A0AA86JGV1_9BURK|nr:hypothetical protein EV673_0009 [Limnobacter thiooxidans]BET26871.1 hypothetical protein RGQ30_23720 [Limnobacter thiooxidans]
MNFFGKCFLGALTICLLGHSAVSAQNRISQNNFGQHKEHERLAIEKKRLELEALTPKKVVPSHSATLLLSSSTQILNQTTSCLDKSNEVIYFTSDGAFEYAMKDAADKNWDAIVQDCWVFVKLTVANNTLPDSVSDNYFYYRNISKLETLGVLDKSNVQYQLHGSKEVFNQKLADVTVSVSVYRAKDIHRYR